MKTLFVIASVAVLGALGHSAFDDRHLVITSVAGNGWGDYNLTLSFAVGTESPVDLVGVRVKDGEPASVSYRRNGANTERHLTIRATRMDTTKLPRDVPLSSEPLLQVEIEFAGDGLDANWEKAHKVNLFVELGSKNKYSVDAGKDSAINIALATSAVQR